MYRVTWIWGNGCRCPCCRVEKPMFEDFDTEKEALQHAAELIAAGMMDEDFSEVQVFKGEAVDIETDDFHELVQTELRVVFCKDMEDGPNKEAQRRKYAAMCEQEDEDQPEEV